MSIKIKTKENLTRDGEEGRSESPVNPIAEVAHMVEEVTGGTRF